MHNDFKNELVKAGGETQGGDHQHQFIRQSCREKKIPLRLVTFILGPFSRVGFADLQCILAEFVSGLHFNENH